MAFIKNGQGSSLGVIAAPKPAQAESTKEVIENDEKVRQPIKQIVKGS